MRTEKCVQNISLGTESLNPFERPRRRWKFNIKWILAKEE
jgi:hypothetical protein